MREVQSGGGADDDRQRLLQRQAFVVVGELARDPAQVLAVQVLHGEEVRAAHLADVIDVGDVGLVQRGGQARLAQEHPDELLVRGVLRQDALEDDVLLEAFDSRRPRQVDLRHPAIGDAVHDLVFAETRARADEVCSGSLNTNR